MVKHSLHSSGSLHHFMSDHVQTYMDVLQFCLLGQTYSFRNETSRGDSLSNGSDIVYTMHKLLVLITWERKSKSIWQLFKPKGELVFGNLLLNK